MKNMRAQLINRMIAKAFKVHKYRMTHIDMYNIDYPHVFQGRPLQFELDKDMFSYINIDETSHMRFNSPL